MDCVISELCYKGMFLKRNYRKLTITWTPNFSPDFICKIISEALQCSPFIALCLGSIAIDCVIR